MCRNLFFMIYKHRAKLKGKKKKRTENEQVDVMFISLPVRSTNTHTRPTFAHYSLSWHYQCTTNSKREMDERVIPFPRVISVCMCLRDDADDV